MNNVIRHIDGDLLGLAEICFKKQKEGFPGGWVVKIIYRNGEKQGIITVHFSTLIKALNYIKREFKKYGE